MAAAKPQVFANTADNKLSFLSCVGDTVRVMILGWVLCLTCASPAPTVEPLDVSWSELAEVSCMASSADENDPFDLERLLDTSDSCDEQGLEANLGD